MKRIFLEFKGKITAQPVPVVTPEDVSRIIRRDFAPERHEVVQAALSEYSQREAARVQLAVLKLANGDLDALHRHIDTAKRDYRECVSSG